MRNHVCPARSVIVNPGVTPSLFPETIVQVPGAGPASVFEARTTSSGVSGLVPARLTNQLPFGTSSTVLTFIARRSKSTSPGFAKRFRTKSYSSSGSHFCAADASSVSTSSHTGSSG